MKYLMLVVVLLGCNDKKNMANRQILKQDVKPQNTEVTVPKKNELLGVWTGGSGPNASFRIDKDSIYNVEHFTMTKYSYDNGTINVYYDDEIYTSKVFKWHSDTLLFEDQYGKNKYWHFTD